MKNFRKHFIGTKLISSALVMSLLLCCFTACSKDDDTSVNVSAESNANIEEQTNDDDSNQGDIDDGDVEEVIAQASNGQYTYDVYGTTISMDVNIDDYLSVNDAGRTYFRLPQLAYDLGWLGSDIYSEIDDDVRESYSSTAYTFHSGDMVSILMMGDYTEQMPDFNQGQIQSIGIRYSIDDGTRSNSYYNDESPLHIDMSCYFDRHYSDVNYYMIGTAWGMSYEDMVIIAYIFWSEATNPGNNPLVLLFGTESTYCTSGYSSIMTSIEYNLP